MYLLQPFNRHMTSPALLTAAGRLAICLLLLFAVSTHVAAQEEAQPDPEPEPAPAKVPAPDRWRAAAELTLTDAQGNQNVRVFTTGFTLEHLQRDLFKLILKTQARYGRSDGAAVAENYRVSLDLDLGPGNRMAPFLQSNAERDPFKRLDLRVSSGAGARFRLYENSDAGNLSISLGVLHSFESASSAVSGATSQMARVNAQLRGMRRLSAGVTINQNAQYQPVYGTIDDYLLTLDTSLRVLLTRRVALSVSHEFDRDSRPAQEVRKDDRLLKAGVLIEL